MILRLRETRTANFRGFISRCWLSVITYDNILYDITKYKRVHAWGKMFSGKLNWTEGERSDRAHTTAVPPTVITSMLFSAIGRLQVARKLQGKREERRRERDYCDMHQKYLRLVPTFNFATHANIYFILLLSTPFLNNIR